MHLDIKTRQEKVEDEMRTFSPLACCSYKSRGREREEEPHPYMTLFEEDRQRIWGSKAHRRLQYKTQVFFMPTNPHIRTRLTHTYEVVSIAKELATALGLNDILTDAIAMGHDIGHTPFGHAGERAISEILRKEGYNTEFRHNEFSVIVAQYIERQGRGLNLTWEVKDGIIKHSVGGSSNYVSSKAATLEGQIVSYADKIAYTISDLNDAQRSGLVTQVPDCAMFLGRNQREREEALKTCLIESSAGTGEIRMEGDVAEAFNELRSFLMRNVYKSDVLLEETEFHRKIIHALYNNPDVIDKKRGRDIFENIACLTDGEALAYYKKLL